MTPRGWLIVRADCDSRIGTGHVMRTLALGQAWRAHGGPVGFISRCESVAVRERIQAAGMDLVRVEASHPDARDLALTLSHLEELAQRTGEPREDNWVVTDGYDFDPAYHLALRSEAWRLMVIDDMAHLPRYHAAVVLNQNTRAEECEYVCDSDTRKLLGTRYALLRAEFLSWRDWQRETKEVVRRILVTMGGGDLENATLTVLQGLRQIRGIEAVVVVGPNNPHLATLRRAAEQSPGRRVVTAVSDMAKLMAWADLAVSAGGSTCWELAFMGLPTVTLVLAPNQQRIAEGLASAGASINLGTLEQVSVPVLAEALDGLLVDAGRRLSMSHAGRSLIDGHGASRVVAALRSGTDAH